jgi:hypothetical protein
MSRAQDKISLSVQDRSSKQGNIARVVFTVGIDQHHHRTACNPYAAGHRAEIARLALMANDQCRVSASDSSGRISAGVINDYHLTRQTMQFAQYLRDTAFLIVRGHNDADVERQDGRHPADCKSS